MTIPNSWLGFWHVLIRFEADKIAPSMALRNAIGVTVPLVAGALLNEIAAGVVISTGALIVSFTDSYAPYRLRGQRMLVASVVVGAGIAAGALSGNHPLVAIGMAAGWAFVAGMLAALGPAAGDIGLVSLVMLIVFAAEPMGIERAALSGLLATMGGLFQTVLALALWPLRRYDPERKALGEFYLELARAAESTINASEPPPATNQSIHAHESLSALGRDHSTQGERYRSLLNQAERIRLNLVTLTRLQVRLKREAAGSKESEILQPCFALSARLLASVGHSLLSSASLEPAAGMLKELSQATLQLRGSEEPASSPQAPSLPASSQAAALAVDARRQMDALSGQLRAAVDLAASATPAGVEVFHRKDAARPWRLRVEGTLAILRANLSLQSGICRHAIRLACCMAVGDALARGLDWQRSYWLPMTIAIVLKPDFTATFTRGVLRLGGTFAGLAMATALFHFLAAAVATEVALIAGFTFLLRCFGPANYGILVTAVTALIVLIFAITGVPPQDVIGARALNTVVGGAIALIAYAIWPTWEHTQVSDAMAQLLDAYRQYFRALQQGYVSGESSLADELDRTRVSARRARTNVEASVDRLGAEPGTSAASVTALTAMLASSHRLAHAMMALEAALSQSNPAPPSAAFRTYANHTELTLYYLSARLRGSHLGTSDLPDLREDHHALLKAGDTLTERYALVNVETDRITNSLNTLREQIFEWQGSKV